MVQRLPVTDDTIYTPEDFVLRNRRQFLQTHYQRCAVVLGRARTEGRQEDVDAAETMLSLLERHGKRELPAEMLARLQEIQTAQWARRIEAAKLAREQPAPAPVEQEAAIMACPEPRPSETRPVLPIDVWAVLASLWTCGCTHPSSVQCMKCSGSCMCHVGAPAVESYGATGKP